MKKLIHKAFQWIENYQNQCVTLLVLFVNAIILAVITEFISRDNLGSTFEFLYYYSFQFLLTTTVIFITGLFLVLLTNTIEVAVIFNCLFFPVFAAINFFKVDFRKEPVFPWDFFVMGEAVDILSEISLSITTAMIVGIVCIVLMIVGVFLLRFRLKVKTGFRGVKNRAIVALFLTSFTIFFGYFSFFNDGFLRYNGISINQWDQAKGYSKGGLVPSFIMNFKYIKVQKPEGYSKETVTEIAEAVEKSDTATQLKPNIIVIMSEAFTDLTRADGLIFNEPLMPNLQSLRDNYISGYTFVSQFGGGTANSEFEALTSYSLAHLPGGCTPYQQFVLKDTDAIPSFLSSQGYNTVAIHTFGRRFWNRDNVYKRFGFDYFVASDNFTLPERERGFISDYELTARIIAEYEKSKDSGKPFFNFSVSVQNHTSYKPNEFPQDEQLSITSKYGITAEPDNKTEEKAEEPEEPVGEILTETTPEPISERLFGMVTTLATGLHKSDEALGQLVDYFSKQSEPTVIVFFGDHLAKFNESFTTYEQIGYVNETESLESLFKLYTTPFVVWNNFSEKKVSDVNVSSYGLLPYVFNELNIVRPTYYNYLNEQSKTFMGYEKGFFLDGAGNPTRDVTEQMSDYFKKFSLLQYDLFSGKGYVSDLLWNKTP